MTEENGSDSARYSQADGLSGEGNGSYSAGHSGAEVAPSWTFAPTAAFTPGPWSACGVERGGCNCVTVMCQDHPVAVATSGDWGDDFLSVRLVGDSLDLKAEPFMDQITYGHVSPEVAKANARLIATAPDMLAVLWEMFCEPGPVTVCLAGNPIACDALEARARAAIAKAVGSAAPSEPKAVVPSAAPHPGMNQKVPL